MFSYLLHFLNIIGALGFFIYGMKIMSEAMQRAAGNSLREILKSMTKNKYVGLLIGLLVTAIIQSSSATTVMVVSFVNAGLLTVAESVGVIMGVNIGTTITAWLVSIVGFSNFTISVFCLPIIAVGFIMLFVKKLKNWGECLIGFALLFFGLDLLKNSVPEIEKYPALITYIGEFSDKGFFSTLAFILIGTLLTIIIQSSSASVALTLTMSHNGWIPLEACAAMILGENIGTTITAQLASLIGNVHAKRVAWIHTCFNLIGVFWMMFLIHQALSLIDIYIIQKTFGMTSVFIDNTAQPIALSAFHTLFNTTNSILLIGFSDQLVKLSAYIVPSKGKLDEQHHLEYFQTGLMTTSEIALLESRKEIIKFAEIDHRMLFFFKNLLTNTDDEEAQKIIERIKKYEDITDKIEIEIVNYLIKNAEKELTHSAALKLRSQLSIVRDLERVGDIFFQMAGVLEQKRNEKIWFTPQQRNNLLDIIHLVDVSFDVMIQNLQAKDEDVNLSKAEKAEQNINIKRDEIRKKHWISIENKDYDIKSGFIYSDLFSSMEKVGDKIMNVSEALAGKI
jgi:phosphate:Na+ symporter